jgi:hypothetical protein
MLGYARKTLGDSLPPKPVCWPRRCRIMRKRSTVELRSSVASVKVPGPILSKTLPYSTKAIYRRGRAPIQTPSVFPHVRKLEREGVFNKVRPDGDGGNGDLGHGMIRESRDDAESRRGDGNRGGGPFGQSSELPIPQRFSPVPTLADTRRWLRLHRSVRCVGAKQAEIIGRRHRASSVRCAAAPVPWRPIVCEPEMCASPPRAPPQCPSPRRYRS